MKDVPLIPPAPVHELPEWKGSTVPFDAPKYDKPEWNGGVIPNDAPIVDKPEIDLKDIPMMPPAPVLDLPELVIQDTPAPKEDKPKTEIPTLEQKGKKVEETTYVTKGQHLPATGDAEETYLLFGGIVISVLAIGMYGMKQNGE